jgi:hypothetical protein
MGVVFYYGFTADYGGATDSTFEWWTSGFGAGAGAGALLLGGLAGLVAVLVSWRHRLPLTFVAMPVLMVIGMMAVTPSALREKLTPSTTQRRSVSRTWAWVLVPVHVPSASPRMRSTRSSTSDTSAEVAPAVSVVATERSY